MENKDTKERRVIATRVLTLYANENGREGDGATDSRPCTLDSKIELCAPGGAK